MAPGNYTGLATECLLFASAAPWVNVSDHIWEVGEMRNRLLGRPLVRVLAAAMVAAAILTALGALSPGSSPSLAGSVVAGSAFGASPPGRGLALNIAVTGPATASTAQDNDPAANAIHGRASTSWCSTQWTGTLTVDLGQVQRLSGLGFTLGSMDTTASVSLSYATTAGAWQRPRSTQQMSVPAGEPVYLPASGSGLKARYAQLSVTDNDGTP